MKLFLILLAAAGLLSGCNNSKPGEPGQETIWEAAKIITKQDMVNAGGEDAFFAILPVDDAMREYMVQGGSYPAEGALISTDELRVLHVLHYNAGDTICGEMICNKAIADDLLAIFRELFHASYPVERMALIDEYGADDESSMRANNSSCFCYRVIAGSTRLSNHAKGMAVDINPLYNPYIKITDEKTVLQPATAGAYLDRDASFPYKIDENDLAYKLFKARGFDWGGEWTSLKDYQHFEK